MMRAEEIMPERAALLAICLLPVLIWLVFRLGVDYGLCVAADAEDARNALRRMVDKEVERRTATRPDQ